MGITQLKDMDYSMLGAFKEELSESNGAVRVFIHPASALIDLGKANPKLNPLQFLKRIIARVPLKRCPIIIFEDPSNRWLLDAELEDLDYKRNIYLVDTEQEDPRPVMGWEECLSLFQALGVERVVIGGAFLLLVERENFGARRSAKFKKENPADSYKIQGCVYGAGLHFSQYFEIVISHFVTIFPRTVYGDYCGKFKPSDHLV